VKFVCGFVWIDPLHYVPLARSAEAAGWDGVVLSDHLVHLETIATPYPYAADGRRPWQAADPYPDVWVSIGAMAAVTERLRFYQGVYVVPMRRRAPQRCCRATAWRWASGSAGCARSSCWWASASRIAPSAPRRCST
jgi:alkanesulfonate monooxygenase SsuD/methylene tetrahydromethanopterin reductase-like flavin-dependent oxidoreductase (luciferase family)